MESFNLVCCVSRRTSGVLERDGGADHCFRERKEEFDLTLGPLCCSEMLKTFPKGSVTSLISQVQW